MKKFRLSLRAEQSLEDIFAWTIDQFGVDQANKYKDQLIGRLNSLTAGKLPRGKPCNVLLPDKRNITDLEYYREGRHYIIYRDTDQALFVVDFVHSARDLETLIKQLSVQK